MNDVFFFKKKRKENQIKKKERPRRFPVVGFWSAVAIFQSITSPSTSFRSSHLTPVSSSLTSLAFCGAWLDFFVDSTRLYCVNWVWLGFTGLDFGAFEFHLLISSLIESDRVLLLETIFFLSLTGFDWVRLDFTGLYFWAFEFYLMIRSYTEFYCS